MAEEVGKSAGIAAGTSMVGLASLAGQKSIL